MSKQDTEVPFDTSIKKHLYSLIERVDILGV